MGRGTPKIIHDHFLVCGEGKEPRAAGALTPPESPPLTTDYVALALVSGRAVPGRTVDTAGGPGAVPFLPLGINKFKLILFHSPSYIFA